jgi:peptide-methionine (S)-S-oxide reductase
VAQVVTERFQSELTKRGYGQITTEIKPEQPYFYAEDHHQQYLLKNPFGYRCHSTTGLKVPRG